MEMPVSSRGAERVTLRWRPGSGVGPVRLPESKSIAARALVLSFLYKYSKRADVKILNAPDCDDTRELEEAIDLLGQWMETDKEYVYNLGSGGTSLRFFLALVASIPGFRGSVDCEAALRSRPIKPLLEALRAAGASIEGEMAPFRVEGRFLDGGCVNVDTDVSSQFLSALMMASLLWKKPLGKIGEVNVSRPYVEMTRCVMEEFGRIAEIDFGMAGDPAYNIEGDWSAASYFYELALILAYRDKGFRELMLENVIPPAESKQGDGKCAEIFDGVGIKSEFKKGLSGLNAWGSARLSYDKDVGLRAASGETVMLNLKDTPDLVPALAVALCCAGIHFELSGVGNLRYKESDRLATLTEELLKAGWIVRPGDDSLAWSGERCESSFGTDPVFSSHGDHRIAMAMAMTAPLFRSVTIEGAAAIRKSFPDFLSQLEKVGIFVEEKE